MTCTNWLEKNGKSDAIGDTRVNGSENSGPDLLDYHGTPGECALGPDGLFGLEARGVFI